MKELETENETSKELIEENKNENNENENEEEEEEEEEEEQEDGLHPLENKWNFWFLKRVVGVNAQENYENNIKKVGSFDTVEHMWGYYNFMVRPNDAPNSCDYHLFKDGIKPMWEDDGNKNGGKWIVRLRKGMGSRSWENLLLAVVGEQFAPYGSEVCGIVISIRMNEDLLSLWTRNANNKEAKDFIARQMQSILGLGNNIPVEYKVHMASLQGAVSSGERKQRAIEKSNIDHRSNDRNKSGYSNVPEWMNTTNESSSSSSATTSTSRDNSVSESFVRDKQLFENELKVERNKGGNDTIGDLNYMHSTTTTTATETATATKETSPKS